MPRVQMQEPTFLILAALADGPKHGYALIEEAAQLSGGTVRLRVGTLYTALDRLARDGLIAPAGEEIVAGKTRRFYALTGEGRASLEAEVARMEALARRAAARLGSRPSLGGA